MLVLQPTKNQLSPPKLAISQKANLSTENIDQVIQSSPLGN